MLETREGRAKFNILTTFLSQLITIICGFIVPRIMIQTFGSEVYGATTSIAQFLSYISLLEGGIGGVARAALYKPLAEKNIKGISDVYHLMKRFFCIVGIIFIGYTFVIGIFYYDIANITAFDRTFTFFLVIAISISTMVQYFWGIANLALLNADQKRYVSNLAVMVTTIINMLMIFVLVQLGFNILLVKLCSSFIFILRPFWFSIYVKRKYKLKKSKDPDKRLLSQKWTGLGQHIAYFLHTNTDVVLLTIFSDLSVVSIYSVYNLISTGIKNVVTSFSGGMESVFGDMLAKKEYHLFKEAYFKYELMLSIMTMVMYETAGILVLPFVELYTKGVTDAPYIQPRFAIILLLSEALNCIQIPCTSLPVAVNKFKETRWGAYGEAAFNIILSLILIRKNPLIGVATGTLVSVVFQNIFYMSYVSKNIFQSSIIRVFLKKYFLKILCMLTIICMGMRIISNTSINSFLEWGTYGFLTIMLVIPITCIFNAFLYYKEIKRFWLFGRKADKEKK